ncbi:hypothetical protein C0416_03200 [bacterium]|nr:hypothetical protein [bacterium]
MADDKRQFGVETENKVDTLEPGRVEQKPDTKEVHEAKTSVGIEAGEIIEGSEVSNEEVSESEKRQKESYSGGSTGANTSQLAGTKEPEYPSINKMAAQVENELKKEIKDLQKKISAVMRKGKNLDAAHLNSLVSRLRQLKEALASLAYATVDAIKDLWHRYVK